MTDAPGTAHDGPSDRGADGPARPAGPRAPGPAVFVSAVRGLLERPLASYYLLLATVGLLLVIGLTMVFSATAVTQYGLGHSPYSLLVQQLAAAGVGLIAFWACQRLPRRTYRAMARLLLMISMALLAMLDLIILLSAGTASSPHLGPIQASGLWLNVGPVVLQPSEVAKFALVIWGADVLVRKGERIVEWRELMNPLFPVVGLLFVLVGYADLGTMLVLLTIFVGMLFVAGVRGRVFGVMLGVALVGVMGLVFAPGKGYRIDRFTAFLDPAHCNQDDCFQIKQGWYAIAHGGWFGVGLGDGTLKWNWLPEAHNDFIFAVIAEELGVVGCVTVVTLFAVLAYAGFRIARRVPDNFRRLAASAVTLWFVGQALINIGGVIRLVPVTGLVLPFISHGGSALVVSLAAVGMLASFARTEPEAAAALHARPSGKWVQLLWAPLPAIARSNRPRDAAGPPEPEHPADGVPGPRRPTVPRRRK
ncbi:FtsW/RodA/SpoVE family cell cycle protein [Hamadaea tsunoensis]|uniref:FtsW/RodA/SpoVE family cell cycle protein n=1 Tax=Hamadaea tsunoensis TaxID=53368 RepID=UPI0003FFBD80